MGLMYWKKCKMVIIIIRIVICRHRIRSKLWSSNLIKLRWKYFSIVILFYYYFAKMITKKIKNYFTNKFVFLFNILIALK